MPDTKITALTAIGANPIIPATFPIPMVDLTDTSMAASGTTKKVTVNQILGAGGTATLASATITGAATVGTTLGVTGVSTFAAGTALLPALTTTGDTNTGIYYPAADTFAVTTGGTERYRVDSAGQLGIGVTPSANQGKLQINQALGSTIDGALRMTDNATTSFILNNVSSGVSAVWSSGQLAFGTGNNTFSEKMRLDASGRLLVGLTSGNNAVQVAGNIGLPNSCTASGETSGVFSIDVANLLTLTGGNWRQTSILIVYSGIDSGASNPTVLQTVVTLTGLATWDTISKNDIVGTASVAVSNDTTTGARITVTVPTGNSGTVYAVLLGGAGATTRPSITINA